jgi:hypothetical protein
VLDAFDRERELFVAFERDDDAGRARSGDAGGAEVCSPAAAPAGATPGKRGADRSG